MSLTVKTEFDQKVAKVILNGALDSSTAPQLDEKIREIIPQQPEKLVLDVAKLDFMSSAGLRVIIFAKQKLDAKTPLILVKPQDQLVETLKMTGLIHSVHIVNTYPE